MSIQKNESMTQSIAESECSSAFCVERNVSCSGIITQLYSTQKKTNTSHQCFLRLIEAGGKRR